MFRRFKKAIAASAVCVLVMGIAAYAQNQAPAQRKTGAAKRQTVQQQAQQGQPNDAAGLRDKLRERARGRMGSLHGMLMPPHPEMVQKLAQRLGLSEPQKEQIRQLYQQFATTVKPIREQRIAALKAFMTAFKNPNVTKAEMQRLSEPILQADKAILDAEFDFWLAFRPILNTQQQAQLHSFMMEQAGPDLGVDRGERIPRTRNQNPVAPSKK